MRKRVGSGQVRERKERRAQERQQVEGGMALPPDADEPDELPDYEDRDEVCIWTLRAPDNPSRWRGSISCLPLR